MDLRSISENPLHVLSDVKTWLTDKLSLISNFDFTIYIEFVLMYHDKSISWYSYTFINIIKYESP